MKCWIVDSFNSRKRYAPYPLWTDGMGYAAMKHIVRAILFIALISFMASSVAFAGLFIAGAVSESFIVSLLSLVGCIFSLAGVSWVMENS